MSDATNRLALGLPPEQENLLATGAPTLADQWRFNKAMATQPPPDVNALWPPNNPVGTERLRLNEPSVGVARGEFDPVVDRWPTGKPRTLSEYRGIEDTSLNLYDMAGMMAPGGGQPRMAAQVRGGSMRGPRATPLPPPPGSRSTESLSGRLGVNADAHFESLGLPVYHEIVPSTRTGPLTEAEIKSGAPRGQVFDLSETWKVPTSPRSTLRAWIRMPAGAGARRRTCRRRSTTRSSSASCASWPSTAPGWVGPTGTTRSR